MKQRAIRSVVFVTLVTCWLCICVKANNENLTIFLERGRRGIVPCPPIAANQTTVAETDAVFMYWYFNQLCGKSLLISLFQGTVAPQNGISQGIYDINIDQLSLVIENVTDSDEGIYFFKLKPKLGQIRTGFVTVNVKVSPRDPFPSVNDCKTTGASQCEVTVPYDQATGNVTCKVAVAKPAVALRWMRVSADGDSRLVEEVTLIIEHVMVQSDGKRTAGGSWFLINNTYTTLASIQLSSFDDVATYVCQAIGGDALGDQNGSYVTVTVSKQAAPDKTETGTVWGNVVPTSEANTCPEAWIIIALCVCIGFMVMIFVVLWMKRFRTKRSHYMESRSFSNV